MAGLKEIKRRIRSVKNTRKITYAMKLVSAAKLRRAQDAVSNSREYTDSLKGLLLELLAEREGGKLTHPLLEPHEELRKIGFVVLGGNRGLCGGYNANLNRRLEIEIADKRAQYPDAEIDFAVLGKKPWEYFRRKKREMKEEYHDLSEDALEWPIDEIAKSVSARYESEELDAVYVIYTKFRSALTVTPVCEKLLPLDSSTFFGQAGTDENQTAPTSSGLVIFEPSAPEVFRQLLPRMVAAQLQQAALDAKASEHGSRMTAMDAATKNAGELVQRLQLKHNKLRQSAITADLLDIIGGAEALN